MDFMFRHRHADVVEWAWFIVTHYDVMWELMWGDTGVFLPAFQLAHKLEYHYQSPALPRMALFDTVRHLDILSRPC